VWMRALAAFSPTLVGGVAAGWATAHSDIRIELVADDSKAVELALINRNIDYRVAPGASQRAATELFIDTRRGGVRLIVRTPRASGRGASAAEWKRRGWTRWGWRNCSGRRPLVPEPPRSIEREVCEDRVGARAFHSEQRLEHAGALVEPACLRRRFQHRVL